MAGLSKLSKLRSAPGTRPPPSMHRVQAPRFAGPTERTAARSARPRAARAQAHSPDVASQLLRRELGGIPVAEPDTPLERQADQAAARALAVSAAGIDGAEAAAAASPASDPAHAPSGPLAPDVRRRFERGFGADFGDVRVRTAPELAQALGARAFTVGNDVTFDRGQLAPGTPAGDRLIAHELAHVIQQRAGGPAHVQREMTAEARAAKRARPTFHAGQLVTTNRQVDLMSDVGGAPGRKPVAMVAKGTMMRLDAPHPQGRGRVFFATVMLTPRTPDPTRSGIVAAEWLDPAPALDEFQAPAASLESSEQLPSGEHVLAFEDQGGEMVFDRRSQSDYIDQRVQAVGVSLILGGYAIYLAGHRDPFFIRDSEIRTDLRDGHPFNDTVFASFDAAKAEAGRRGAPFAYYRTIDGIVAPTVFSPASAPRIMELAAKGFREIGRMGEQIFTSMAIGMIGGKALSIVIGRIIRLSGGPESPPPGKGPPPSQEASKAPAPQPGRTPAPAEKAPGRAQGQTAAAAEIDAATLQGLFQRGLTDDGAAEAYIFALSRRLSRQAQIELQGFLRGFSRPSDGLKVLQSKPPDPVRFFERRAEAVTAGGQGVPLGAKLRPVNGVVSIGGGGAGKKEGDISKQTNLQPFIEETGGPSPKAATTIPNVVVATGEELGNVFQPGSITRLTSSRLPYESVEWNTLAKNAHAAMAPGGRLNLNVWARVREEREAVLKAFRDAGFKNVRVGLDDAPPGSSLREFTELGPGMIVQGTK